MNVGSIGLLAFIAEGIGLSIGIILLYVFRIKNKRLIGMLFGSTSGLMIALMCFDVLPQAMDVGHMDNVIIGVIIGICIGLLLEDIADGISSLFKSTATSKLATTGLVFFVGIAIHNIPEGFAIGTLALTSEDTITKLAFIIALHSIPEGIALAIPLKAGGVKIDFLLLMSLFLGGIMGTSAIGGYFLSTMNPSLLTIMLGIAAGVILYIVCNELIPESRKTWNGRMTTVATIIGIILGMLLVH